MYSQMFKKLSLIKENEHLLHKKLLIEDKKEVKCFILAELFDSGIQQLFSCTLVSPLQTDNMDWGQHVSEISSKAGIWLLHLGV